MKFLKNTATDLFAHGARFINNVSVGDKGGDERPSYTEEEIKKANEEAINEGYKQKEINGVTQWMKESCTKLSGSVEAFWEAFIKKYPERANWTNKAQNELLDKYLKIKAEKEKAEKETKEIKSHKVVPGDTLGVIVGKLTGNKSLNYRQAILYKSKKINAKRRADWKVKVKEQGTDCLDIPPNMGIAKEEFFGMDTANLIYPGQYVYLDKNGVIIIDDNKPPVDPVVDPEDKGPLPDDAPDTPRVTGCKFSLVQELNGLPPAEKLKAFEDMADNANVSVEKARADYNLLYGIKDKENGVERDGVYVVLEKYLNRWGGIPIVDIIQEWTHLDGESDLAKDFIKAGYTEAEAQKFVTTLKGEAEKVDSMNFDTKKLDNEDAGATKEFAIRAALGGGVAFATLAVLGTNPLTAIPTLMSGIQLLKLNIGSSGSNKVLNADLVYDMFKEDPEQFKALLKQIGTEGNLTVSETYTGSHKDALGLSKATITLGDDVLSINPIFMTGPDPENPLTKLTEKQQQEYEKADKHIEVVDTKIASLVKELLRAEKDIAGGVKREAGDASASKYYGLEDGSWWALWLDDLIFKTEDDDYFEKLEKALAEKTPEKREELYIELMNILINRFNENSEGLMKCEWKDKLGLGKERDNTETLNAAFKNGERFSLGTLGEPSKDGSVRHLEMQFTSEQGLAERDKALHKISKRLEDLEGKPIDEELLPELDAALSELWSLKVQDYKGKERIAQRISSIISHIQKYPGQYLESPRANLKKAIEELSVFKEKEKLTRNTEEKHQGENGTWEVFLSQKNKDGSITKKTRSMFNRSEAIIILKNADPIEIKEKLGIAADMLSKDERKALIKKLENSLPMVNQLTQMSFLKDLMNESHQYLATGAKGQETIDSFDETLHENETVGERRHRIATAAFLRQIESWKNFEDIFVKKKVRGAKTFPDFSASSLPLIEAVYSADKTEKAAAMDQLVSAPAFQQDMAKLGTYLDQVNQYMHIDDLAECIQKRKDEVSLSGDTAVKSPKEITVSYGTVRMAELIWKGLPIEQSETTLKQLEYITGYNNETGEAITYTFEQEVTKIVNQWARDGLLTDLAKETIAAALGGHIPNGLLDIKNNDPAKSTKTEQVKK